MLITGPPPTFTKGAVVTGIRINHKYLKTYKNVTVKCRYHKK